MSIEEKLMLLPEEARREALEFIDFLFTKYGKQHDGEFWLAAAEHRLKETWDNPEDDRYHELLER
jgi:hypothetical protein